jgi:ABC-type nitrate/sulfonate/bicarbonate transport system substrate-binding protein
MANRKYAFIGAVGVVSIAVLFLLLRHAKFPPDAPPPQESPVIRLGWQTAWATQGQIIQSLMHTNIPQLYDSKIIFSSYLYGPPLNEAALGDAIDCTNSGIVPTINLLAKSDDWIIVGRQVDFPVAIVARKDSGIRAVSDLRGKKFGVPLAGGSHPYALARLHDNGLSEGGGPDGVQVINLAPSEHLLAMDQAVVDAVAVWEPTITILLDKGATIIDQDRYVGFIAVRKSLAGKSPDAIVALLKSYIEANYYVATHRDQTDQWFADAAHMSLDLVRRLMVIDPNVNAKSIDQIEIGLDDNRIAKTQQVADVMYQLKLIDRPLKISERVDTSYLERAIRELRESGY